MYKVLVFDIDGVLTNGKVLVSELGEEYKDFSLLEIDEISELKKDGYKIVAVTGERSKITEFFRQKVDWDDFYGGCKGKVDAVKKIEVKFKVSSNEICYIGDGKYDIEAIKYAGLGVAPANAIDEVKAVADYVLKGHGGKDCIQDLRKLLNKIATKSEWPVSTRHVSALDRFKLDGRVCVITGGAGLMGKNHAEAVLAGGGVPVLLDISQTAVEAARNALHESEPLGEVRTYCVDITNRCALENIRDELLQEFGHIDILINNAANNPKMERASANMGAIPFEEFPLSAWQDDIAVSLTGSLLCAQIFGAVMTKQGKGVILNISSDLGVIAPDQRIYRREGVPEEQQTKKPVTYSVVKHGLIGLTKYIATYWADKGVRCNALCPAGIENGQDELFIQKLTNLVPMGRMATKDEYQSTVLYMVSDASAYMTGATVIVDGGRTCW